MRNDYRMLPFWHWNGRMDLDEIRRQIAEMASKGVGGFFLLPRQGLEIPYLSDEWFRRVRHAVETAASRGLQVWLYDEYPYPSGMAGGEIAIRHPEARHCTLEAPVLRVSSKSGELRDGVFTHTFGAVRMLSIYAVPLRAGVRDWSVAVDLTGEVGILQRQAVFQKTGLTAYNDKRFFTADPVRVLHWLVPQGDWEIHAYLEKEITDFKYYGSYFDPCNTAAVETFIQLTHEGYATAVGDYFGKTIKGFFTDETGFLGRVAWSPSLPDYFIQRNGYDLRQYLNALFCPEIPGAPKVRYDYFQSLHELLRERYHGRLRQWCSDHNLLYIAETPSLRNTTQLYADIPATDSGHEKIGRSIQAVNRKNGRSLRYNPKMATSLGSQRGIARILVECFHSVGWSMTLQDAKWMIDRFWAMGVTCFNPSAFFYTTDDLRKHDAPPSLFFQNPNWQDFRMLTDYAARGSELMESGQAVCPIAVLDPITSLWTLMANPMEDLAYCGNDPMEAERMERLRDDWIDLTTGLLSVRRDYQHLDPEMLAKAEVIEGVLRIGYSRYTVLILPPITNLEKAAWMVIKEFIKQGGVVIGTGMLPITQIEGPMESDSSVFDLSSIRECFDTDDAALSTYWQERSTANLFSENQCRQVGRLAWVPRQGFGRCEDWVTAILQRSDQLEPSPVIFNSSPESTDFLVQTRISPEGKPRIFISNQGGGCHRVDVSLQLKAFERMGLKLGCDLAEAIVTRIDLTSGEYYRVESTHVNMRWVFGYRFGPFEAAFFELGQPAQTNVSTSELRPSVNPLDSILELPLLSEWEVALSDLNVLRVDRFAVEIDGVALGMASALPFIHQCAELNPQLKLDYKQVFGTPVKVAPHYPCRLKLSTTWKIAKLPPRCILRVEEKTIQGEFKLSVNGHPMKGFSDFSLNGIEITEWLEHDQNILSFEGIVQSDEDGIVDAVYLEGDFGISIMADGSHVMTECPRRCKFPLPPNNSFPYFSGTFLLRQKLNLQESVPDEALVKVPVCEGDFHQVAHLKISSVDLGKCAWKPYVWRCPERISEGEHMVELSIRSGLEGRFEGRYFDYAAHKVRNYQRF